MNQLPPTESAAPPPDPSADEPAAGFALNGYLNLLGVQNQALRKLAALLDPPLPLPPPPPPEGPARADGSA